MPVSLLVVLDGFGHNDDAEANAIAHARTPTWDRFLAQHPHTLISGSGTDVGLPDGQMGNSEVGHMNLGAGRVVYQDFTRINEAIKQGEFANNPTIDRTFEKLRASGGTLHVMGLLSPGGVHSHEEQIFELLRIAKSKGIERAYLHAFLDGRDTPPKSAAASILAADRLLSDLGLGCVATVIGRYFAMDRDQRWDRVERAYNLIVSGEAPFQAPDAASAVEMAYARGETDEFVQPTTIHREGESGLMLHESDAIIHMNFRADRARQLTRAFTDPSFDGFKRRSMVALTDYVTLTRYADDIEASCAFQPATLSNTLGEVLSTLGKRQLRVAETEKYAHVTFFFSGGREQPFDGEERILIPSPKVATYDLQPEMSAIEVTDALVDGIGSGAYDVIICNYANADMVGHTGIFDAAVKAVETLDRSLARIAEALSATGGQMLVTADHGNVERMVDPTSEQPHTAHTCQPVPLVYVGPQAVELADDGTLSDVAPTLLDLMHLEIPAEMTGRSLLRLQERTRA